MTTERRFRTAGRVLALLAALAGLNFALSFHNIWPTPWITARPELSIEGAVLVLALALYMEWRTPPRRAVYGLAGLLTLLALARYVEVTAPALYGRAVNLYWDARHLPKVAAMMIEAAPGWLVAAAVVGVVAVIALAWAGLAAALTVLTRGFSRPAMRRGTAGAMAAVVALFAVGHSDLPLRTLRWYSLPISMTYYQQLRFVGEALAAPDRINTGQPLSVHDLGALDGSDVIVSFLESYGAVVFDEPGLREDTRAGRRDLAAAVADTNRQAVSAFVRSPTFGGVSWLAHASFMTGLEITTNRQYNLLLTRDIETLPQLFREHGYKAVAVMPGMKAAWPEGAFYGFDRIYGETDLDYEGPAFGWWRIPDQFALARLDELELDRDSRPPVAAFFPTINTHLPFRPTPPLQPDWDRLLSARPFEPDRVAASLAETPEWTNLRPAYAGTINYTYRYWGAYLRRHASRPLVVVLIGDHQPAASVSGRGARWDVPVHVIADDPAIIRRLRRAGFRLGLVPGGEAIAPMHEAVHTVLASLSRAPGAGRAEHRHDRGTGGGDGEQG